MSVLAFRDVGVSYGDRVAVRGFTDEVGSGEWVGVIGPNGAGKSSLLRAVAGLVSCSGEIAVDDEPIGHLRDRERARLVAYVPQDPLIPDDMTVEEYVLLGRTPYVGYLGTYARKDHDVVDEVLGRLELEAFADRPLGALSGGERQRAVLARALAQQAPVLLLDEPTSALDIGHQQQALELVTELRRHQGLTVVSALHDLTLAGSYTDRLVLMNVGEVVSSGTAAKVLTVDRLAEVYQVSVSVNVEADGSVVVVPRRSGRPG